MSIREKITKEGRKTYIVQVEGVNARGHRIQVKRTGIRSHRQAEKVEFELKRQLANKRAESPCYIWEEWFDACIQKMQVTYKPSTLLGYTGKNRHWILPFWKGKPIDAITPHDVHEVVYNPAMECSWHTRKTTLKYIKRILTLACEQGLISQNPALAVKVKTPQVKQDVLNRTEIATLLSEAKAVNHRFYPIWTMALRTGMRSGELYALKWCDVDLVNATIHVARFWNSKNGFGETKSAKYRVIPISAELKKLLSELKLSQSSGREFVLPHHREWQMGTQAQVLREFCKAIGITSVRFHDLRATFITRMLSQGVSLAVVMAIVGHSQLSTTQAYLRLAGLDIKGATEKLGIELPSCDGAKVLSISEVFSR